MFFEVLVVTSVAKTATEHAYDGPDHGFDRAMSSQVDSGVGDDPKSSKTINANDEVFALAA